MPASVSLYTLGFALVLIGVLVLIAAAILVVVAQAKKGNVKTAGIIIIGPVPIVFGSERKDVKALLSLSIILTVCLIVGALIYYFLFR